MVKNALLHCFGTLRRNGGHTDHDDRRDPRKYMDHGWQRSRVDLLRALHSQPIRISYRDDVDMLNRRSRDRLFLASKRNDRYRYDGNRERTWSSSCLNGRDDRFRGLFRRQDVAALGQHQSIPSSLGFKSLRSYKGLALDYHTNVYHRFGGIGCLRVTILLWRYRPIPNQRDTND